MIILNIAAGKMQPILTDEELKDTSFTVNLDPMYYSCVNPEDVEDEYDIWDTISEKRFYTGVTAIPFMERTRMIFDKVCIYRYLEHVSFTNVEYFIYLLSTITEPGSEIDVIVPNYRVLADLILNERVYSKEFHADNIVVTTELLNEPSCPHASIWTPDRSEYFFELEKRFKIESIDPRYEFDGRSIYIRFKARRV